MLRRQPPELLTVRIRNCLFFGAGPAPPRRRGSHNQPKLLRPDAAAAQHWGSALLRANADHDSAQEHLDKLADLLPVAIFRTSPAGNCVYANDELCQLAGVMRETLLGDGWVQAIHPEDRERVLEAWNKATSDTEAFGDEFRLQRPDGTVRTVSVRAVPFLDESGIPNGYVGATADTTDRQRTEEALRELAHALRERVKALDCLYGISDIVEASSGSLEGILEETAKLLPGSWEYSEIAGARIVMDGREFRTDNFSDTPWTQSAHIFVHGKRAGEIEVCYLEERPTRDEGPFSAEERRLLGAIADRLGHVAGRLQTENVLRVREQAMRERLTHLSRVSTLGEMASSIGHEVNQPLTAIATYARACRRMIEAGTIDGPEILDVLEHINSEAQRAGTIIHHLRELARRRGSTRVECDINRLVRDVEQLASVDSRLHDVHLRFQLCSSPPPVLADGVQIQQVILNLVRNGIDATQDTDLKSREVLVRTAVPDDWMVEVSVRDNGCGVPDDAEHRIFQPFFTTKENGIGMGLSISRSIVTSHGGRLWFSRNRMRGTTFFFTIPRILGDDRGAP